MAHASETGTAVVIKLSAHIEMNFISRVKRSISFRLHYQFFRVFRPDLLGTTYVGLVSKRGPIILYVMANEHSVYERIAANLPNEKIVLMLQFAWTREGKWAAWDAEQELLARQHYPHLEFVSLCNSKKEVELCRLHGMDAILCNHNAFIDCNIFTPIPLEKKYDAVYDGQLSPYKRHQLCEQLTSVVNITTKCAAEHFSQPHIDEIRSILPQATWINPPWLDHRSLNPQEVNAIYNSAKVGLILSAEEGACYASIQYLLAGLPVVSTINIGGRDEFADPRYWITTDPNSDAVAEATNKLIKRNIDPQIIRNSTIQKMNEHLQRFKNKVDEVVKKVNPKRSFVDEWPSVYYHKLIQPRMYFQLKELVS